MYFLLKNNVVRLGCWSYVFVFEGVNGGEFLVYCVGSFIFYIISVVEEFSEFYFVCILFNVRVYFLVFW